MEKHPITIIGIAGVTGCGKSTLAHSLARELLSPLHFISADDYHTGRNRAAGHSEGPASVDLSSLIDDLQEIRRMFSTAQSPLPEMLIGGAGKRRSIRVNEQNLWTSIDEFGQIFVVVEGFLLFCSRDLSELCNVKIWIEGQLENCMKQRFYRQRDGWKDEQHFNNWYRTVAWEQYLSYREEQLANILGCLNLNGNEEPATLLASAAAHCREFVPLVPVLLQRGVSDEYGIGASAYSEDTLAEWKRLAEDGKLALQRAELGCLSIRNQFATGLCKNICGIVTCIETARQFSWSNSSVARWIITAPG